MSKTRSATKELRVTLVGGGARARQIARLLGRFAAVSVEPRGAAVDAGRKRNGSLVVDLRQRRGSGIDALVSALVGAVRSEVEREISNRQSEFVSITSHELRTPLTSSREAVALVADGLAGSVTPEQRAYLEMAARNLARLTSVVNQLLDLSDIEKGRIVLLRAPAGMNAIVEAAADRWALRFAERRIGFAWLPADRDVVAHVDAERVGHALDALLDNALKFTDAGGSVRVVVRGLVRFVEIAVEDTGCGIPPSARRLVFRKFRQADAALTRRHGGLGLGLTVTREIVRSHRGRIRAEGREAGGTRVVVRFPRGSGRS
jgi:signal transduction histidine kinase